MRDDLDAQAQEAANVTAAQKAALRLFSAMPAERVHTHIQKSKEERRRLRRWARHWNLKGWAQRRG